MHGALHNTLHAIHPANAFARTPLPLQPALQALRPAAHRLLRCCGCGCCQHTHTVCQGHWHSEPGQQVVGVVGEQRMGQQQGARAAGKACEA
jgi:hypothetical protein